MCQQCVNNLIDLLPDDMSWSERMDVLWNYTAFPAGSPETVERQLREYADNLREPKERTMTGIVLPEGTEYTITVTFVETDELTGEWMYEATVKEFPDVAVYEYHPGKAYWGAVDIIEELAAMAIQMGHDYPRSEKYKAETVKKDRGEQ